MYKVVLGCVAPKHVIDVGNLNEEDTKALVGPKSNIAKARKVKVA